MRCNGNKHPVPKGLSETTVNVTIACGDGAGGNHKRMSNAYYSVGLEMQ